MYYLLVDKKNKEEFIFDNKEKLKKFLISFDNDIINSDYNFSLYESEDLPEKVKFSLHKSYNYNLEIKTKEE